MSDEVETLEAPSATDATSTVDTTTETTQQEEVIVAEKPAEIVPPTWQENWRDTYLQQKGLDLATPEGKKASKWLDRYASPAAALDALKAAQTKIDSAVVKPPLPKDATEQQVAEWRAENGIPETPDGYLENLANGLVVGEADKPFIDLFTARLHGKNASPEIVQECLAGYYEVVEQQAIWRAEQDAQFHDDSLIELKGEYGPDYKRNINMVGGLLDQLGPEVKNIMLSARTAQGRHFGDDTTIMRALVGLAREINPTASVVSGSGAGAASSIDAEIKGLEDRMGTKAWFKDEAAQSRYRELIDARERIKR